MCFKILFLNIAQILVKCLTTYKCICDESFVFTEQVIEINEYWSNGSIHVQFVNDFVFSERVVFICLWN